jgi:hypothetical protein
MKQLLAADETRRLAMLRADVSTPDSLLADDALIVWGDGTTDNKSSALELFRSGRLRYTRLENTNTRARLYGETGIVTGDARVQVQSDGHRLEQFVRLTRVYVKQQARWRLVVSQTTRVPWNSAS